MAKSSCPSQQKLADFLCGTLPPGPAATLTNHLEQCPLCDQTLDALEQQGIVDWVACNLREPPPVDTFASESACGEVTRIVESIAWEEGASGHVQLGSYRLLAPIGAGAMGIVCKALHTQLEKVVALKILPPQWASDAARAELFRNEMRALGRLDHPNLVCATDAGELDGVPFLAMQYVDGIDLRRLLKLKGPLQPAAAAEIARQAALALEQVHAAKMVHRDVKPSNLMLTLSSEGAAQVKLLDLGLAVLRDHAELDDGLQGTLQFMAPEQLRSEPLDIRADLWALGATLYAVLTGESPRKDVEWEGWMRAKERAVRSPVAWPSETDLRRLPSQLQPLVGRLLAPSPSARPDSPKQVADWAAPLCDGHALEQWLSDARLLAEQETELRKGLEPPQRWRELTEQQGPAKPRPAAARKPPRRPWSSWRIWLLLGGVAACGILYFATHSGALLIEVNDPRIRVSLDASGEQIEVRDGQSVVKVWPGRHQIHVRRGATRLSTAEFQVSRGEEVRFRLQSLPTGELLALRVPASGVPSDSGVATSPAPTPPGPPAPTQPPTPYDSATRRAIEWALEIGGEVAIADEQNRYSRLTALADLPAASRPLFIILTNNPRATDRGLEELRRAHITRLNLRGAPITQRALPLIGELTTLNELILSETKLPPGSVRQLANLHQLKSLDLRNLQLSLEDVAAIGQIPQLKTLSITAHSKSAWNLHPLKPLGGLEQLALGGEGADDAVVTDVALQFPQLRSLEIAFGRVSDDGLAHIAALEHLTTLNLMRAEGLTSRAFDLLSRLRKLESLVISQSSNVTFERLERLSEAPIHSLAFSFTQFDDEALKRVAELWPGLISLNIQECRVTDSGLQWLTRFRRLQTLSLIGNSQLTDEAVPRLESLESLRSLFVVGTSLSDEGLASLRQSLSNCQVVSRYPSASTLNEK